MIDDCRPPPFGEEEKDDVAGPILGQKNVDRMLGPSMSIVFGGHADAISALTRRRQQNDDIFPPPISQSDAPIDRRREIASPLRPEREPFSSGFIGDDEEDERSSSSSSSDACEDATTTITKESSSRREEELRRDATSRGYAIARFFSSCVSSADATAIEDSTPSEQLQEATTIPYAAINVNRSRLDESENRRDAQPQRRRPIASDRGCSFGCFSERARRLDAVVAVTFSLLTAAFVMATSLSNRGVADRTKGVAGEGEDREGEDGWLFALVEAMIPFACVALVDSTWRRRREVARLGILLGFGLASIASVVTGVSIGAIVDREPLRRYASPIPETRGGVVGFFGRVFTLFDLPLSSAGTTIAFLKGVAFVTLGLYVGMRCRSAATRSTSSSSSPAPEFGDDDSGFSWFASRKRWRRRPTARETIASSNPSPRPPSLLHPDGTLNSRAIAEEKRRLDGMVSDSYTIAAVWTHALAVLVVFMDVVANGGVANHPMLAMAIAGSMFVPVVTLLAHLCVTKISMTGETATTMSRTARSACLLTSIAAISSTIAQFAFGIALPIMGVASALASGKMSRADLMAMTHRGAGSAGRGGDIDRVDGDGREGGFGFRAFYALCGTDAVSPADCALLSLKTYLAIFGSVALCVVSARLLFAMAIRTTRTTVSRSSAR